MEVNHYVANFRLVDNACVCVCYSCMHVGSCMGIDVIMFKCLVCVTQL